MFLIIYIDRGSSSLQDWMDKRIESWDTSIGNHERCRSSMSMKASSSWSAESNAAGEALGRVGDAGCEEPYTSLKRLLEGEGEANVNDAYIFLLSGVEKAWAAAGLSSGSSSS